jgi:protein-tyrosine phosphatase
MLEKKTPYRILMVCMGNICRSPLAEAVLQQKLKAVSWGTEIQVDSAGTHGYHVGGAPDPRSVAVGEAKGYALAHQRSRLLKPEDFETFDLILVMDKRNLRDARAIAPTPALAEKAKLLLDFAQEPLLETEVPDPYYGGNDGFQHVLHLLEVACEGLLKPLGQTLSTAQ